MEAATVTAMMGPPVRNLEQQLEALDKANRHRTYRSEVKKRIRRREDSVLPYLLDPPEQMASMKIYDLLLAVPKWGRTKVNRLLVRCRISPSKTLGGMSDRQRAELAKVLLGG